MKRREKDESRLGSEVERISHVAHTSLTWKANSSPPKEVKAKKRKKVKTDIAFSLWAVWTSSSRQTAVVH